MRAAGSSWQERWTPLLAVAVLVALSASCRTNKAEDRSLTVLLTGFEPFGQHRTNSSWEAIKDIAPDAVTGAQIEIAQLPVDHARATRRLNQALRESKPEVVICFGMAARRKTVSLELKAHNLDREIAFGASGPVWKNSPIVTGGPETYAPTLHIEQIRTALKTAGVPVRRSPNAGSYVCNHVFYRLMHVTRRRSTCAGFVHVPAIRSKPMEGLTRQQLRRAAMTIVRAEIAAIRKERTPR